MSPQELLPDHVSLEFFVIAVLANVLIIAGLRLIYGPIVHKRSVRAAADGQEVAEPGVQPTEPTLR